MDWTDHAESHAQFCSSRARWSQGRRNSGRQLLERSSHAGESKLIRGRGLELILPGMESNKRGGCMEVEMKIRGLMMDPVTNMPIVVLKDVDGNSILPIWVGIYEANAIALEIEKVSTPRPMTHDLI